MIAQKLSLLIHHHAVAYVDSDGAIWLPSFIGRWVAAIAPLVDKIGLLLYESDTRTARQDERLTAANVRLHSLGKPGDAGSRWQRGKRIERLKAVCAQASADYDMLLIRGSTPRQSHVWRATAARHKAFLLVGSLTQNRPPIGHSLASAYVWLMSHYRPREVKRMAAHGTLMLANSPLLTDELRELTGRQAAFVPTNSIHRDEFAPLHVRPMSASPRLLFCGRVVPDKGVGELIEALSLRGAEDYHLDIVGAALPADKERFERQIAALGVGQRVHWHGQVPFGDSLFAFFRAADVFVLPTYSEGFPHVLWEAAAQCCPVVATRVGGIPSLWQDRTHCLLITPKSSRAIVEAVETLRQNDDLRSEMVQAAYHHALDYTVERCAERLVEVLYNDL